MVTSREKNISINSGSVKCIHNLWHVLNEKERDMSINNFCMKLETGDLYSSSYVQCVKKEYTMLLREKFDTKLIWVSLRIFYTLSLTENHKKYINTFLVEFVNCIKNARKQQQDIINGVVSQHLWETFQEMEMRDLFFIYIRPCCLKEGAVYLMHLLDELLLNIVRKNGLVNIYNTIGIEESARLCMWYFNLAPDFYPWVEYEHVDSKFSFEYTGECMACIEGFTDSCGVKKRTMAHEHTTYVGKSKKIFTSYGSDY